VREVRIDYVEAICNRNATLLTADTGINFMLKVLESQKNKIAEDLVDALTARLQYRRSDNSSVLQYLHWGNLDYNDMFWGVAMLAKLPGFDSWLQPNILTLFSVHVLYTG